MPFFHSAWESTSDVGFTLREGGGVLISYWLKGQYHEKVGEMRVQGDSLGPN
jgi:hypothetical protein